MITFKEYLSETKSIKKRAKLPSRKRFFIQFALIDTNVEYELGRFMYKQFEEYLKRPKAVQHNKESQIQWIREFRTDYYTLAHLYPSAEIGHGYWQTKINKWIRMFLGLEFSV